jgi:hypothetical protein
MNERVQISIREGPVILLNAPATEVTGTYPLWNGASASEFFPSPGEGNFYDVTIEKPVKHVREVRLVEEELIDALVLIAAAWSFSGRSCMVIQSRHIISSSDFKSNADEVERRFLASDDLIGLASAEFPS